MTRKLEVLRLQQSHAIRMLLFDRRKTVMFGKKMVNNQEEDLGEKMHERLHSYNIECPQCGENHNYSSHDVRTIANTPRNPDRQVSVDENEDELGEKMHARLHSYNVECKQCGTAHAPFAVDTNVFEHLFAGSHSQEEDGQEGIGDKMHNRLHSYNVECPQCGENHKYSSHDVRTVASTPRNPDRQPPADESEDELGERMHARLHSYNVECKQCGTTHAPFSVDTNIFEYLFAGSNSQEDEEHVSEKMHERLHSYNIECPQCGGKDKNCGCK